MREGLLTVAVALAVAMVGWAPAFATSLAALKLDPPTGGPGTDVRVTGTWFAAPGDARYVDVSPVQIRWGGVEGPVVAVVEPDEGGTFITPVSVPPGAGEAPDVLVGVQTVTYPDGRAGRAPGTPARAVFGTNKPPMEGSDAPAPAGATAPRITAGWAGGAAAVGFMLFVGAGACLVRDLTRRGHELIGMEAHAGPTRPVRSIRKGKIRA